MLAMQYRGPCRVRVAHKAEPAIEHPGDAIVRVTRSCICGSDLHALDHYDHMIDLVATSGGLLERARAALRRRAKWAPSGAGEKEKARRRLQMARGLLSFGPHGRGR